MTLVLRWRVPEPRIATRWRGPAGLAEAIEREPLYPVAAVVGPPGSGGSVAFPPLAVSANATTPVPEGGAGSTAWSTWLDQPLLWDGGAWRTINHFAQIAPAPHWVPDGAIVVSDFVNGRYWRVDIGQCALENIWENGAGYNGTWFPAMVIPGQGLIASKMPQAVPEVLALLDPAGAGFTMVMDARVDQGVEPAADCYLGALFTHAAYSNEWSGMAYIPSPASGIEPFITCADYDGSAWRTPLPGVALLGRHRVATSITEDGVEVALDGLATLARTRAQFTRQPKSDSSWEMLVLGCFDHGDAVAYVESAVFFPHRDAAELAGLTATPPVPVNVIPPAISGLALVGATLVAGAGTWAHAPTAFAFRWRANGIDIVGATASTFVVSSAQIGSVITVAVVATNPAGASVEAVSPPTEAIVGSYVIDFAAGVLPAAVTLTRASPATYIDGAGLMRTAGVDVARFDHDPITLAPRGLLVEPAATNLLSRSQEFDHGTWAPFNLTVAGNAAASPDGAATAERLNDTATAERHILYRDQTVTPGPHCFSAYFKAAERSHANLALLNGGASTIYGSAYGLVGATLGGETAVGSPSGVARSIERAGNEFVRCSITMNLPGADLSPRLGPADSANPTWLAGNASYIGNGSGIFAWGAQLEAGDRATTYIPTIAGAATRAKDEITVTVPAGYSQLLVTYDDDSTSSVPCTEGLNLYDASDFSRHRIKSLEGAA